MFHFDPSDYLCPSYLKKNTNATYNTHHVSTTSSNTTHSTKVHATSA